MAFKDLHKLKKIVEVQKEYIQVPHLVVGKDIFALSIYKSLQQKYGKENVRLLSEDAILKSDLLPKGPSTVRGESNQKIIQELYPQSIVSTGTEQAMFYKDMTWKSFGGRSKSEALKFNEEFFTSPRFNIDATKIFPELENAESFVGEINAEAYQVRLKSIHRSGDGFKVECLNGSEFECEKLYFGQSPYQYLNFYSNKNELADAFIEFWESTKTPSALFVKFVFEKPITDMQQTLFIPLSYTHDWGHFVGEFNETKNTTYNDIIAAQEIEFIHFLDEDHTSEEDVSRVIRLLKKSLDKIFEKYSKINSREYIVLEQEIGCLKIDNDLFVKTLSEGKGDSTNLFLLGINAPIVDTQCEDTSFEYSKNAVDIMARGLLVHSIVSKKI
ncbi:MAG: hypothetical protein EHM20_02810 [Alphaproteobacteria bacterium]|nr:MAG: hypothetical protein EHM20_02810 [Alphaproteobacteria bacterium]